MWHIQVSSQISMEGFRYAWLVDPILGVDGKPLASAPKVLDPCARMVDTGHASDWNRRVEGSKYSPLAVVPDFRALMAFNWEGVTSPGLELKDLVVYEAHVRSFTRHPDSGLSQPSNAGTFLGFVEKIPHLLRLGINCVELLPIFEFDETACPRLHPETGQYLCQYWGYQTAAYYAPMQRLASGSSSNIGTAIVEFKTLVRELHRHGIEVILDVVFNHTGEGAWGENNWHSLSKVAETHYYLMSNGHHTNYTGCGNTVNANNPLCSEWICDCLRYWALEMKVDGFRFDLASSMTRGADGQILPDPPCIRRLTSDPCLQHVKLIAEPWDCSWPDGYLVGKFPSCGQPRWAEWNGKFRDTVRKFIKGDAGMKGQFASRMCGSEDLYAHDGRGPCHSLNFITSHDGFTLRDLVTYNQKHNSLNAEESGDDNNMSWNCGSKEDEGPTTDPEVLALRERQMRNLMLALFLSAGTPMLSAGDEYGRSQGGNNNTWCQDNELNWFSWKDCAAEEAGFVRFMRLLIGLRKQHSHFFCRTDFMTAQNISWNHSDWDDQYNYLSFILHSGTDNSSDADCAEGAGCAESSDQASRPSDTPGSSNDTRSEGGSTYGSSRGSGSASSGTRSTSVAAQSSKLLVAFNAGHQAFSCHLPAGCDWYRIVDSSLEAPRDICESDEDAQAITGESYVMTPYSCIVLRSFQDPADALSYSNLEFECVEEQKVAHQLQDVVQRPYSSHLFEEDDYTEVACFEETLEGSNKPLRSTMQVPRGSPRNYGGA
ncbi:unnamed protein product [Polarella glacialis]|uniref:Glycosyl hydrolase family 13 catalytic domain-containing protein n=1 Tax=Polarella glacialis TaxID=89957 RepID=A0A813HQP2_POLGL|nr:unnamed protein product [Polarella glacialis]